jgi:hypothetical protein
MNKKIPFDWKDPAQVKIIDDLKISGYLPPGVTLHKGITYKKGTDTYTLETAVGGNGVCEPVFWTSGIIPNDKNMNSAYVKSTIYNPKYKF